MCLASGKSLNPEATSGGESLDLLTGLAGLSSLQLRAALWVVGGLMEDVTRLDLNSGKK